MKSYIPFASSSSDFFVKLGNVNSFLSFDLFADTLLATLMSVS